MGKKMTQGQLKFLKAIYEGNGGIFHRRVVDPMFEARYVFPRPGNMFFWIVGCNGHAANDFFLTEAGYDALPEKYRQHLPRAA